MADGVRWWRGGLLRGWPHVISLEECAKQHQDPAVAALPVGLNPAGAQQRTRVKARRRCPRVAQARARRRGDKAAVHTRRSNATLPPVNRRP
eukprot:6663605-Prymnesium_polylepis.1